MEGGAWGDLLAPYCVVGGAAVPCGGCWVGGLPLGAFLRWDRVGLEELPLGDEGACRGMEAPEKDFSY